MIHIHRANGCRREYLAQRYLFDTELMEIIEGSTQIQQMTIARVGVSRRFVVSAYT
ncbi:MAG: acyl-CoA dehydrogenase family protein [Chloroflexota bacterium]